MEVESLYLKKKTIERLSSYRKTKGVTYSLGSQYTHEFENFLFIPSALTPWIEYNDDLNDKSGYRIENIDQHINTKSVYAQNEWKDEMWNWQELSYLFRCNKKIVWLVAIISLSDFIAISL